MINYKQMKMQLNDPEYCNELKPTLSSMITKREVGARRIIVRKGKGEGDFSFFFSFFHEKMLSLLQKEKNSKQAL